jgi:DNA polymerase I-like protein with 3'-5' exonuclease and polymerase domains
MPVVTVAAEMELTGVCIDIEYAKRLSQKYHKKYDDLQDKIKIELSKFDKQINDWRLTGEANFHPKKSTGKGLGKSKSEQLENPINLASPTQLAILLYDVLKIKSVSKKSPRGTGEDILKKINLPICNLILEERGLLKLINTYIDKLPECISKKDGRLHAHFNQYGASTGRFSSSDPNLQNIPSHNNEIRMMFTSSPGYTLVGGDYSQQEPRLLAHYSGDEHMIDAYKQGKDLYAVIAL